MKTIKRIGLALVMALVLLSWSIIARTGEIHDAAKAGDVAKVKTLLAGNPDLVNAKEKTYGWMPLHWAARINSKNMIELLLANKADVNVRDNQGVTPLRLAGRNTRKDVIELFRQHGGVEYDR